MSKKLEIWSNNLIIWNNPLKHLNAPWWLSVRIQVSHYMIIRKRISQRANQKWVLPMHTFEVNHSLTELINSLVSKTELFIVFVICWDVFQSTLAMFRACALCLPWPLCTCLCVCVCVCVCVGICICLYQCECVHVFKVKERERVVACSLTPLV